MRRYVQVYGGSPFVRRNKSAAQKYPVAALTISAPLRAIAPRPGDRKKRLPSASGQAGVIGRPVAVELDFQGPANFLVLG